jgi:hypothetical protein
MFACVVHKLYTCANVHTHTHTFQLDISRWVKVVIKLTCFCLSGGG